VLDGLGIGESGHSVYAPPKSAVKELTPETIPSIPSPTLAPSRSIRAQELTANSGGPNRCSSNQKTKTAVRIDGNKDYPLFAHLKCLLT
jgi:hypothetical protein